MEETTRAATANLNTRAAGRGPGCNMESPIRGDREEGAPTPGTGLPAAGAPPTRREAVPRSGGVQAGSGAEESYPANTTPGGTGGEVEGRLSPAALPPRAADSEQGGEEKGS